MKRRTHFIFTFLFTLALSLCCLVGCKDGKAAAVVEATAENRVAIRVNDAEDNATLLSVMETLREEGELSFELSGTMIASINGKANAADWSACWMLYTSDAEMGDPNYTLEYDGKTLVSANLGADALTVLAGELYVWEYVVF